MRWNRYRLWSWQNFGEWFAVFDGHAWDRQIEEDASTGKLDYLAAEALADG